MLPWLPAYLEMMPVLQARESLQSIMEVSVGGGHMKQNVQRRIIRQLTRQAKGPVSQRQQQRIKPRSAAEHAAMLASIGVQRVDDG